MDYLQNYANINLQNNKKFKLECFKQNILSLEYASHILKCDKHFVLEYIKQDGNALKYANIDL